MTSYPEEMVTTRLLIVGATAAGLLDRVHSTYPQIELQSQASADGLKQCLEAFRPTVVHVVNSRQLDDGDWTMLIAFDSVRWIHLGNVGIDRLPQWDPGRLTITNSAGAAADEMAEYVIGAMLMINTGFLDWRISQTKGLWKQTWWTPLRGKTLVAVGAGRIGERVIAKAGDLGVRIIAVRNKVLPTPGAEATFGVSRLHDALGEADFIAIQIPLTRETRHLIDAAALARVRRSAWIINVSRGDVIDERALTEALVAKRLGGAVLDVFSHEPLPRESPLWGLDNVVVTPHASSCVTNWSAIIGEIFLTNLHRFQSCLALHNIVSPRPIEVVAAYGTRG
jgi:phosphoglycerate dehydrogenase-like enzyme